MSQDHQTNQTTNKNPNANKNDTDPTIIISDQPQQDKYELLKEKLRYKQAKRENSKKIDHKQIRLNIQADALPSKTFLS